MALQSCTNFEMYRLDGPLPGFQSPAAFFHNLSIPLSLAKPTYFSLFTGGVGENHIQMHRNPSEVHGENTTCDTLNPASGGASEVEVLFFGWDKF